MSKEKKKHSVVKGILIALLGVIVICLVWEGVRAVRDFAGYSGQDKNYVIEIPEGAGSSQIAAILENRGVIDCPYVFKIYARLSGGTYQTGKFTLNPKMSYPELSGKLQNYPDKGGVNDVTVAVPEGYETRQIADLLAEKGLVDKDAFMDELEHGEFAYDFIDKIEREENRLEGYLFPATYVISINATEHEIIDMMLKKFNDTVVPIYNESATGYTLDEVVTLASIIEREAGNDEERGRVASVFNNRLYEGMKLESCATVQYILGERKAVLSTADTKIDSKYNTYKYGGLPIGPIASPGEASVRAALNPDKTNYMYFVAKADGSGNVFAETFDEHQENIKKYQGSGNASNDDEEE